MKVFLIAPVRDCPDDLRAWLDQYVRALETEGYEVYYPPRDTDQVDSTGLRICKDNRAGIQGADEVHIAWDGKSSGSLFDLGMAFALGKNIAVVPGQFPPATEGKSFPSMVRHWGRVGC